MIMPDDLAVLLIGYEHLVGKEARALIPEWVIPPDVSGQIIHDPDTATSQVIMSMHELRWRWWEGWKVERDVFQWS